MTCEGFLAVATDLARNQIMEADERASAEAHIDECDDCRQAWSDQLALSENLRMVADQMRTSRAPGHLEAQLLAAFCEQTGVPSSQRASLRWRYWMSAAAAVLVLAMGLLVWRWHVGTVRQPSAQASVKKSDAANPASREQEQPPQALASPGELVKRSSEGQRGITNRRATPSRLARRNDIKGIKSPPVIAPEKANAASTEVTTDFLPVGYGATSDLQDGGQLVRVELPRSALVRFGLPMNMDRADERVKADVLVGADGLARAIRFVQVKASNKN